MRKRIICFCFMCILLLSACCMPAFAHKVGPSLSMKIDLNSLPQGTAYVDLLIPIQTNAEVFVDQIDEEKTILSVAGDSMITIESTSEIANYDQGYYSYLFHYKDSTIDVYFDTYSGETWIDYGYGQPLNAQLSKMKNCKLAFVDEHGNILSISDTFTTRNRFCKEFEHVIVDGTTVTPEYYLNPFLITDVVIVLVIFSVVCAVIYFTLRAKHRAKQASHI